MMRFMTGALRGAWSACLYLAMAQSVQAHFIWLVPQTEGDRRTVQVYFSEDASPDDPDLLKHAAGMKLWLLQAGKEPVELQVERSEQSLSARVALESDQNALIVGTHDLGVLNRGDARFRLKYYAKAGPQAGEAAWSEIDCARHLALDVVPTFTEGRVRLQVRFQGQPIAGAQIHASGPNLDDFDGETDSHGIVQLPALTNGLHSIRARHVEQQSGEMDGKPYAEIRHYCTLTLNVPAGHAPAAGPVLQPLEQPVTSFGGAVLNGAVYIFGGHTGSAHSYSEEDQDRFLRRLDLTTGRWETIAEGPPLQGLALVPHGGKLYRIGGFTAKNAPGEEHNLWSQADVAAFDLKTKRWMAMPPLPEPRSSFDAAVLGDTIYVVGGWKLAGDAENVWHETAWAMDLSEQEPQWRPLPAPPFQRRALAVAAHHGKIYAIGGMQHTGGPTTRVDVFDPATGTWSRGPDLASPRSAVSSEAPEDRRGRRPSGGMSGFGSAAFATGGKLYVSTIDGVLQRLSDDGGEWTVVRETPTARFFHRLLPLDEAHLVVVGGANMSIGKFEEVEVIEVR